LKFDPVNDVVMPLVGLAIFAALVWYGYLPLDVVLKIITGEVK
jgi:hypothetical protein